MHAKKLIRRIARVLAVSLLALSLLSCGSASAPVFADLDFTAIDAAKATETNNVTDYVKITVAEYGDIIIRLYPEVAPKTVENFQTLVSQGFYDGLTFHRVIETFVIQTGDPNGDGTGGSAQNIKGEFRLNGFENNLKHVRGVVSMARGDDRDPTTTWDLNSGSCQFFIVHKTYPSLDGNYGSFGYVVSGMDVVDKIAKVSTNASDKPTTDVVITSARFVEVAE
jgi:peptidyl-prolyl cis-trans isomerase B (cyclophilin B)